MMLYGSHYLHHQSKLLVVYAQKDGYAIRVTHYALSALTPLSEFKKETGMKGIFFYTHGKELVLALMAFLWLTREGAWGAGYPVYRYE